MQEKEEIKVRSLQKTNSKELTISIRLTPGGYCFTIYHPQKRKYIALGNRPIGDTEELAQALTEDALTAPDYGRKNVLEESNRWTLLPNPFFDPEKAEKIWQLNFGQTPHGPLHTTPIECLQSVCIWEGDAEKEAAIHQWAEDSLLICTPKNDIENILKKSMEEGNTVVGINVRNEQSDFYAAKNGQLKIAVIHATQSEGDVIYHLMNLYQRLKLDIKKVKTLLWGDVTEKSLLKKEIERYIKEVELLEPNPEVMDSVLEKSKNKTYYTNLLNETICE